MPSLRSKVFVGLLLSIGFLFWLEVWARAAPATPPAAPPRDPRAELPRTSHLSSLRSPSTLTCSSRTSQGFRNIHIWVFLGLALGLIVRAPPARAPACPPARPRAARPKSYH